MKKTRIGALILAASLLFAKPGKVAAMEIDKDDLSDMQSETTIEVVTEEAVPSKEAVEEIIPVEKCYTIEDFNNKVEYFKQELKSRKIKYTDYEVQTFLFLFNFNRLSETEGLITEIMNYYSMPKLREIDAFAKLNGKIGEYNSKILSKKKPDINACILGTDILIDEDDQKMAAEFESKIIDLYAKAELKDKQEATLQLVSIIGWIMENENTDNPWVSYNYSQMTPNLIELGVIYSGLLDGAEYKIDKTGYYYDRALNAGQKIFKAASKQMLSNFDLCDTICDENNSQKDLVITP